jgi:hypothetical protein
MPSPATIFHLAPFRLKVPVARSGRTAWPRGEAAAVYVRTALSCPEGRERADPEETPVAGRVPDEKIDEIRDRADIVQVVSRHVQLRKAGRGFTGLCPFHHEKTPSFHVNPDRQTFHCFGCNVGGNAFTFLMKAEGSTFPEVVERLARELGIELPRRAPTAAESRAKEEREKLLAITTAARAWFADRLRANAAARAYLAERGLTPETIDRFGLGYADDEWSALADHLERTGVPLALAAKAGLLIARQSGGWSLRHRPCSPRDLHNTLARGRRWAAPGRPGRREVPELARDAAVRRRSSSAAPGPRCRSPEERVSSSRGFDHPALPGRPENVVARGTASRRIRGVSWGASR